jgi:hypothetical protein
MSRVSRVMVSKPGFRAVWDDGYLELYHDPTEPGDYSEPEIFILAPDELEAVVTAVMSRIYLRSSPSIGGQE